MGCFSCGEWRTQSREGGLGVIAAAWIDCPETPINSRLRRSAAACTNLLEPRRARYSRGDETNEWEDLTHDGQPRLDRPGPRRRDRDRDPARPFRGPRLRSALARQLPDRLHRDRRAAIQLPPTPTRQHRRPGIPGRTGEIHDGRAPIAGGFTYSMLYLQPDWLRRELRATFDDAPSDRDPGFHANLTEDPRLTLAIAQAFRVLHGREPATAAADRPGAGAGAAARAPRLARGEAIRSTPAAGGAESPRLPACALLPGHRPGRAWPAPAAPTASA